MKKLHIRPMSRGGKITLAVFIWLFSAYVLLCLSGLIAAEYSAKDAKEVWRDWQVGYIDFLEKSYAEDANFCKADEKAFIANNTLEEVLGAKLNDVRYLATHNSYKTGLTPETKYLYHGPFAPFMNKQYDYVFDTVTEQLSLGIRSIELDVGKISTDDGFTIECVHSDSLETNSTMVNFSLGLKEINMWLERNGDCLPVIVLVEPKGGASFDGEAFDMLDGMLVDAFGDKLVKPSNLLGGYADFDAFRKADAYPTVAALKGKIIFLLHEKDSLEAYIARDPDMSDCAMNIALEYKTAYVKHPEYSKYAFTLIANNPTRYFDKIQKAANEGNYMVRTRLDKYAVISKKNYDNGLKSNANILSTDYTPHVVKHLYDYPIDDVWEDKYVATLYEEGKTVALR